MFSRSILSKLQKWADSSDHKPLVLRGARQVGKTVAVKLFARQFERFIYLDLEIADNAEIFRRRLSVQDILQAILIKHKSAGSGRLLLFLDEVQNCPEAVECLRYFYELLPDVYVIAAGSLLEIALFDKHISFPVGRTEHLFMYPVTFREFLAASDEQQAITSLDTLPFPAYAFEHLLTLFHRYTLIGGMPEVVSEYLDKKDIMALTAIYDSLLVAYQDDTGKYARNPTMAAIIRHCIETAPFAAGQRITFAGFGHSNYRSREVGESLRTLERAMLIYLLYPSTSVEIPAMPDMRKSPKLQFLDTGLLNYFAGLQDQYFQHDNLHAFYKGVLAEHVVAQELIAMESNTRKKHCFWVRERSQSQAEVDFILQYRGIVIPVEVKSGKTGTLRSLHQFMDMCPHKYAVRLYAGQLELQQVKTSRGKLFYLLNLPYFLTSQIHRYLEWMMDKK